MKPQDIVVMLKIIALGNQPWRQIPMARDLYLGQGEISRSLKRSHYAGLLDSTGKQVRRMGLMEFLEKGISYVFPQKPGPIVRGLATSHSASPLKESIQSDEHYVWPYAKGGVKGQAIIPLYKTVPDAAIADQELYALLALVDAVRIGSSREKMIAIEELSKRIL